MRTMTEEQKILKALDDEPALARRTVAKAMAGLAIIVGLLLIGLYADDRVGRRPELASAGARQGVESASAIHRREVFEARRARHERTAGNVERVRREAHAR